MNERQKRFLLIFSPVASVALLAWGAFSMVASDSDSEAPSSKQKVEQTETPTPEEEERSETATSESPITEEDRTAAKEVALEYMEGFLTNQPLKELKPLMSHRYYSLISSKDSERPTVEEILEIEATRSENVLEQQGRVSWLVWVKMPRGKEGTYEVAFEVTLSEQEGQWQVEGVSLDEYPEYSD